MAVVVVAVAGVGLIVKKVVHTYGQGCVRRIPSSGHLGLLSRSERRVGRMICEHRYLIRGICWLCLGCVAALGSDAGKVNNYLLSVGSCSV